MWFPLPSTEGGPRGGEDGREVSLKLLEVVRVEALEHMRKYAVGTSATYNKKFRIF